MKFTVLRCLTLTWPPDFDSLFLSSSLGRDYSVDQRTLDGPSLTTETGDSERVSRKNFLFFNFKLLFTPSCSWHGIWQINNNEGIWTTGHGVNDVDRSVISRTHTSLSWPCHSPRIAFALQAGIQTATATLILRQLTTFVSESTRCTVCCTLIELFFTPW